MITERQQEALDWIRAQPQPPTRKEIAEHLGVSRKRASELVHILADKGLLTVKSYEPRGIVI